VPSAPDSEFRIDYTINRRQPGEDDFTEIGFGSSGASGSVADAAYQMESEIQNRRWETSAGMPDPDDV
jgi:hypothetical protein